MRELPPIGPAPTPAPLVVSANQAEGLACIVCNTPGQPGASVNIFMSEGKRMWACFGACSDTMFETLGYTS